MPKTTAYPSACIGQLEPDYNDQTLVQISRQYDIESKIGAIRINNIRVENYWLKADICILETESGKRVESIIK